MKDDNCGEVNPKACKICRRCGHKLRTSSCSSQSDGSARGVRCECGRVLLYAASIKHGKCRICRQNAGSHRQEGAGQ